MIMLFHAKIKNFKLAPDHWNDEGYMDVLINKEVIVSERDFDTKYNLYYYKSKDNKWVECNPNILNQSKWILYHSDFEIFYTEKKDYSFYDFCDKFNLPELLI